MVAPISWTRDDSWVRDDAAVTVANLYAAHRLRLVRLAVLLVDDQDTAEDVVQDVFARAYRVWGGLQEPEKALAYLQRSVVNASRSVLRRRRTARSYVAPHDPPGTGVDSLVILAEEHREVLDALHKLPRRQREVLVLRYWSGLSEGQIADAMGVSAGTVKSTASRALQALERMLEVQQ